MTSLSLIGNSIFVSVKMALSAIVDKSSLYSVISNSPTGTEIDENTNYKRWYQSEEGVENEN